MNIEYFPEKWRIRSIITTETDIDNIQFEHNELTVRLLYTLNYSDQYQPNVKMLDVLIDQSLYPDVEKAYYYLKDQTSRILDFLSFVTYSGFVLHEELGFSVDAVRVGEEFTVYVNLLMLERRLPKTNLNMLQVNQLTDNADHMHWLSLIRSAYNSNTQFESFIYYFSLLESIAQYVVTETITESIKCGICEKTFERDTGRKPTNNFIKKALEDVGATSAQIKYAIKLRGKYAHGSGRRDSFLTNQTLEVLPFLEEACLVKIAEITGLKIHNFTNPRIAGFPLTWAKFKQDSAERAMFLSANSKFPVKLIQLNNRSIGFINNASSMFGIPTTEGNEMPLIDHYSLPHYVE